MEMEMSKETTEKMIMGFTVFLYVVAIGACILFIVLTNSRTAQKEFLERDAPCPSSQGVGPLTVSDIQMKSSYNTCCIPFPAGGKMSYKGIKHAKDLGARILHFSLYSVDGNTVVAAGEKDDEFMIDTINHLDLDEVLENVSELTIYPDPLFLHFRLISRLSRVRDDLANSLEKKLKYKLLGYGDVHDKESLNDRKIPLRPMSELKGKIVIIVSLGDNWWNGEAEVGRMLKSKLSNENDERFLKMIDLCNDFSNFYIYKKGDLLAAAGARPECTFSLMIPINGERTNQLNNESGKNEEHISMNYSESACVDNSVLYKERITRCPVDIANKPIIPETIPLASLPGMTSPPDHHHHAVNEGAHFDDGKDHDGE